MNRPVEYLSSFIKSEQPKTSIELTFETRDYSRLKLIAKSRGYHDTGMFLHHLLMAVIEQPKSMVLPREGEHGDYILDDK
jgi:hypothetical protein